MTDVTGGANIVTLPPRHTLRVASPDAFGSGLVRRIGVAGQPFITGYNRTSKVVASATIYFGPFREPRTYSIEPASGGKLVYDIVQPGNDFTTDLRNVEPFTGSFTLKNDDIGKVFRCDDASAVTITVPNNLEQGFNCEFIKYAAGNVTLSFSSGATNVTAKVAMATQYMRGSLLVTKQVAALNACDVLPGGDFA